MQGSRDSVWRGYVVALAATAVAVLGRWVLDPWLGEYHPTPTLYGAVALTVWFAGYRPAVLAALVGYVACDWLFVDPRGQFSAFENTRNLLGLAAYLLSCAIIIAFGEAMRTARQRAERDRKLALEAGEALKASQAKESRQQQFLYDSERRLQVVQSVGGVGVWEWDLRSNELYWTPELERLYGLPVGSVHVYEDFRRRIHPDDLPTAESVRDEAVAQHRDFAMEFRAVQPNGNIVWILSRGAAEYDESGTAIRVWGVSLDITERKRVEEALQQADRRKDEFIATLAHELRNPLAPIRNAVEVLKATDTPGQLSWARNVIERQVVHMARLLEDLLDVSRISRNRVELRLSRVTLASVVESALETSRPLIDARGHRLTVTLPAETVWLDTDPVRLSQVFSNLLNNAAKYTEKTGQIRFVAERHGSELIASVQDDGMGIVPEMLPRVFEMFEQGKPALERSQGGLGIGLSLAKALVEAMGGRIEAHSDGPGKGSRFDIHLPIAQQSSSERPRADEEGRTRVGKRRFLIADDLKDSADSLAMMLKLLGHDVQTAYDGKAAVAAAESFRPDVAVLDLGMPKLNGYEACRQIRSQEWGKPICVIAVTGWGQDEDRRRTQAAGFDHHLVKPVEAGVLMSLIESLPKSRPVS